MKKESSVLNELIKAFKYYIESKKGKYSLKTYLDIIGEYTDRLIVTGEKEGFSFLGGTCTVANNEHDATYDFKIEMYFQDNEGNNITKEATRSLNKRRFTTETEDEVKNERKFEIYKPR